MRLQTAHSKGLMLPSPDAKMGSKEVEGEGETVQTL